MLVLLDSWYSLDDFREIDNFEASVAAVAAAAVVLLIYREILDTLKKFIFFTGLQNNLHNELQ